MYFKAHINKGTSNQRWLTLLSAFQTFPLPFLSLSGAGERVCVCENNSMRTILLTKRGALPPLRGQSFPGDQASGNRSCAARGEQ